MAYRGKSLKTLRETKQIQLRRIANETRISMAYLEDLEEERFDRFPGKFYFKSFARAYARALGLEPEDVLRDLQSVYEEWSGETAAQPELTAARATHEGILNRIAGYIRGAQEV
jgi:cytoskeletal protein RodZ